MRDFRRKFHFLLIVAAAATWRATTAGDTCPWDRCYHYGNQVIECTDLTLSLVPRFCPQVNVTYDEIDLSDNRLKRIGAYAFRNVSVREVKIRGNLKSVNMTLHPKAFRGLEDVLRKVSFQENSVPELPAGLFRNLVNLTDIDLPKNRIRVIQGGAFRGARNVERINLEENLLQVLDDHAFGGLARLKDLRLARNKISMVHSLAFGSLRQLQRLDLSRNRIRDLQPKTFYALDGLELLDLSHNAVAALFPLMFRGLSRLEDLLLSHNPIILIARDTFSTMSSLKRLELQKCKLTYLKPGVFDGLVNLRVLELQNNMIRSLPSGLFSELRLLKRLQLDFNELSTLNACAFDDVDAVQEVAMTGNPVHCDCLMAWSSRPDTARVHGKCHTPMTSKGQNITQETKYDVCVQTDFKVNCKQMTSYNGAPSYSYAGTNDVMKYKNFFHFRN